MKYSELYNITLNGREAGSIRLIDAKSYMTDLFPGIPYTVNEDDRTIDISATVVQLMELRENRINISTKVNAQVVND